MNAIRAILVSGPLALILASLSGCGASSASETVATVETAPVERRTLEIRAEAAGLLEPVQVVEVKSKASGEILALHAETGDYVERGALLAEIDPRDVENGLIQARADSAVAAERLAIAQTQLRRSEELHEAGFVTRQEFENTRLDEANAASQYLRALTTLDLAKARMEDVRIRAPISGTIIQRDVEIGTIIASASQNISGGTPLMYLADLAEMQVRTLVDETDIGLVSPDMPAEVTVEAFRGRVFAARVYKIEPKAVVDQNVTMFPVLVRLDNEEGLLKPGMNAEVAIHIARRVDVVAIPNAAVVATEDAEAAGIMLGLDEGAVREALRGGPGRLAMANVGDDGGSADAPQAATAGPDAGTAAMPQEAAAESDPCAALRERMRSGGRTSLSDADRTQLRDCFQRSGGFRGGPRGARGGGAAGDIGSRDSRPAIVFVAGPAGPEPRRVMIGLYDWDYTEVVSGLEPGEKVVLVSAVRLQEQQQEFLNRMRARNSGPIPGVGGRGR